MIGELILIFIIIQGRGEERMVIVNLSRVTPCFFFWSSSNCSEVSKPRLISTPHGETTNKCSFYSTHTVQLEKTTNVAGIKTQESRMYFPRSCCTRQIVRRRHSFRYKVYLWSCYREIKTYPLWVCLIVYPLFVCFIIFFSCPLLNGIQND